MPPQFTNRHNRTVSVDRISKRAKPDRFNPRQLKQLKRYCIVALLIVAGSIVVGGPEIQAETDQSRQVQSVETKKPVASSAPSVIYRQFPLIDGSKLTPVQKSIVAIAKSEYAKRPTGYDKSVLAYTEGIKEPWCANFVSWVRDEAGIPYEHPTTGYWRIPGVSTLRDYYRQYDAYFAVDGYAPKLGDVAFYEGNTADANSSEHVALVLGVEGDKLITIGGNETKESILQIRYSKLAAGERGLIGFGRTNVE